MRIVVNGKTLQVPSGSTIAELIDGLGLRKRNVVVERNGEPVDRASAATTALEPDDVVEVVRAVQGG